MQETIVFGGGDFWSTGAVFFIIKGVQLVELGYIDSTQAKLLKIEYDPDIVSLDELLQLFLKSHDPAAIFCTTERQEKRAQHYIKVLKLSTKVEMLEEKFTEK